MLQLEADAERLRQELDDARAAAPRRRRAAAHRQYRRDLVPVRQALAPFPAGAARERGRERGAVVRRGGDTTKSEDETTRKDEDTNTVKRGTGTCR